MKAYLFPGQGSQVKGMGADIFSRYPYFVDIANNVLGYSIEELCLYDTDSLLSQTQFTQSALYIVNALKYQNAIESCSVQPQYLAGHSLGEFNALLAAGVFDFETGLRLVKKRGELMSEACEGRMAAVVGLTEAEVQAVLDDEGFTAIDIANLNSPKQVVISGPNADIIACQAVFEAIVKLRMYKPLNVGGAFHSRLMEDAKKVFAEFLLRHILQEPKIPVISNLTARPYLNEELASTLSNQITNTVRWSESIQFLMRKGVDVFEKIGPGSVLTDLLRSIKRESDPGNIYCTHKTP
jgi:malonyl CoA-acyl carrier protein transacylase